MPETGAEMKFPDIVELNVGGRHVSTFLSTLTKYPDSMLAAMFSGRHPMTRDKDGRFFIDADGDVFVYILNFLRCESMPPPDKSFQVKQCAEYFGIEELKIRLSDDTQPTPDELIAKWKANIPGYAESLSSVKEQIMTCNIAAGYIVLYVKKGIHCDRIIQDEMMDDIYYCEGRPSPIDLPEHLRGTSYIELQVHTACDVNKQAMTLLTLLSHDLKPCGLSTEREPVKGCCYLARILNFRKLSQMNDE